MSVQRRTHSTVVKKIDDDMMCPSMEKCIERHIMSENTHSSRTDEGAEHWRPRDSRRCLVAHITGTAACGFPLLSYSQMCNLLYFEVN